MEKSRGADDQVQLNAAETARSVAYNSPGAFRATPGKQAVNYVLSVLDFAHERLESPRLEVVRKGITMKRALNTPPRRSPMSSFSHAKALPCQGASACNLDYFHSMRRSINPPRRRRFPDHEGGAMSTCFGHHYLWCDEIFIVPAGWHKA